MSDTPPNPLEGLLSDFALGPAWARAKSDSPKEKFKDAGEREYKPRRRDDRGGRDDRDPRGGGRRDDRRQGGGNRRDFKKGGRPDFQQREEIAPAEGVTVTLLPRKQAIQLVCKEIHQVARVYPLFDIAQIILAERDRSNAIFEISEKKDPFYRCKFEDALYLTKDEALQHFLQADWRVRFVEESTVEVDPPKGNFQSVAKCGISGEWLGPPNYHAYQTEIRRIHRERFPNMPFERYLSKVRTERSEEAVNEWLESMKTQTRWRILSDEESAAVAADCIRPAKPETVTEDPVAEKVTEEPPSAAVTEEPAPEPLPEASAPETETSTPETETSAPPADSPETEEPSDETPEAQAEAEPEQPEPTPPADDIKWFADRAEVERAIAAEVLTKAFEITRKAKVSAAIAGKNLSPGLLVRLKGTGTHHRRHPAIIIPTVCKTLEAEHMPVFKRKGKLYTGPARPHALAPDAVLAPRPGEMVKWIRENTPAKLEGLWKAVLPEGATAPPAEYAADLFWLLQQGHILLYTDDTLVVQEQPKPPEPKKPKPPKKKATPVEDSRAPMEDSSAPVEGSRAPMEDSSAPAEDSRAPVQDSRGPVEDSRAPVEDSSASPENSGTPPDENPPPSGTGKEEIPGPAEIIADVVADTKEIVTEAASEIIDAGTSAAAPEAPAPTSEQPEGKAKSETAPSEPATEPSEEIENPSENPSEPPPKDPLP